MTVADEEFRLPDDVDAVLDPQGEEVLVSRRGSRIPPQVLSADAWALLELFRESAIGFEQAEALGELTVRWTGPEEGEIEVDDEFDEPEPPAPTTDPRPTPTPTEPADE